MQPEYMADMPPSFAPGWALFLDIDGTLTRFANMPDAVDIEAEVLDTLGRLDRAMDGAVALITGRAIADVDRMFAPLALPVAGQHGMERRDAKGNFASYPEVARKLRSARAALADLADRHAGLLFEDKGKTLAMHYRGAPEARATVEHVMSREVERLGPDFMLQRGKLIFEIRPSGRDKGTAIADYMTEPPFKGRTPLFIGDDKTDEDGFMVVNQLGGHAIKVGAGETVARSRLADAAVVLGWLESYADFLERE